ncbi:hypothetical protein DSM104443_02799 [Usitatibacter rugosus]|uniref:Methyltransferase FkbM domain-containing protein n=1 Tax=Usitatibacter rugosus TaxID=2732067 RepID=A0A6M4H1H3_9PROT|nr:FkbM family methyltransferase [Usitatibacter rugosus]QJR11717.1 hypothetical protein DSM104443_02799 [Usitatibacter rugosus]
MRDGYGVRLLVNPNDYIGHVLTHTGEFEARTISLARQIMSKGGTFLDVGANLGIFTCCLGALPGVKCIAVDASAQAFTQLMRNVRRNSGVAAAAINVALGTSRGLVHLSTPDEGNLGTTRVDRLQQDNAGLTHLVATVSLDEILSDLNVGPIRLMKIDVEGYELEVFRGMKFSAPYRPENIIVEHEVRVASPDDLRSCYDLLSSHGYVPFTVLGERFEAPQHLPEQNLWWRHSSVIAS